MEVTESADVGFCAIFPCFLSHCEIWMTSGFSSCSWASRLLLLHVARE